VHNDMHTCEQFLNLLVGFGLNCIFWMFVYVWHYVRFLVSLDDFIPMLLAAVALF